MVTTKSISARPREGYREPIYAEYTDGSYINAVGLTNPGAEQFKRELDGIVIPRDKFLLVSVFGETAAEFVEAVRVLRPVANGFELNMSCPHAKGYGAEIGEDAELVSCITRAVVEAARIPVFVKLSANTPEIDTKARIAVGAGASGITVTNTIGPALVFFGEESILSNRVGGLSGAGIRPLALEAVERIRKAVGQEPIIIGMGGVSQPEHVRQFRALGADLVGVGSALTGMSSLKMRTFFEALAYRSADCDEGSLASVKYTSTVSMNYWPVRLVSRRLYSEDLFEVQLDKLPRMAPKKRLGGMYYFICSPGIGEKPFMVFSVEERSFVIKACGAFTHYLRQLPVEAPLLVRGPYGRPFPELRQQEVILVGGETGVASLYEIARSLAAENRLRFLLGARSYTEFFGHRMFEELGPVSVATDDGTAGFKGCVSDLLKSVLRRIPLSERNCLAFVNSGPESMVRTCFNIEKEWVDVERIWGAIECMVSCGVGICGKCANPTGLLTCIDGPFMKVAEFEVTRSFA